MSKANVSMEPVISLKEVEDNQALLEHYSKKAVNIAKEIDKEGWFDTYGYKDEALTWFAELKEAADRAYCHWAKEKGAEE